MTDNPMRTILVEKVTVNMGVGQAGDELKKSKTVIEAITSAKAIETKCRVKQPKWDVRPGLPIGIKVTLRKKHATEFLARALDAKQSIIKKKSFDMQGNFGFGIKEHIDLPGIKYDPKLGIRGLDVLVTLKRNGQRIKKRKIAKRKIGKKHMITKNDAMQFMKEQFGVEIE